MGDYRRFGKWEINGEWGKDRGPDPISNYEDFRSNILNNLEDVAFNGPICETMLNQKYFNGIGNYLSMTPMLTTIQSMKIYLPIGLDAIQSREWITLLIKMEERYGFMGQPGNSNPKMPNPVALN